MIAPYPFNELPATAPPLVPPMAPQTAGNMHDGTEQDSPFVLDCR